nr:uncharacterized protein CI109_003416 [Kwoniella shandongensis]KAA5528128.1 hypothetical protein CI109_003416 [Kwoniella shandongensis]
MAAVAQAPPILPSTSSSGSVPPRPTSSASTSRKQSQPESTTISKSESGDRAPTVAIKLTESTPVEEKGEAKKENGDEQ